jgi:hypothetical protein
VPDGIEDAIRSRVSQDPARFTGSSNEKEVIGVPGTPMPRQEKPMLHVLYVLSGRGQRVVFGDEYAADVERKVKGRQSLPMVNVEFLESGESSRKPFPEQAVFVQVPGDELAVTETQLDEIAGVVTRSRDGVSLKERVYETMA